MKTVLSACQEINATLRSQPCGQFPQGSREDTVASREMQRLLAEILSPSAPSPQINEFIWEKSWILPMPEMMTLY